MAWYRVLPPWRLTDHEITTVWSVFSMDIVATIFGTVFAYKSLAAGWGDLDTLYKIPWTLPPLPAVCGFSRLFCFLLFFNAIFL